MHWGNLSFSSLKIDFHFTPLVPKKLPPLIICSITITLLSTLFLNKTSQIYVNFFKSLNIWKIFRLLKYIWDFFRPLKFFPYMFFPLYFSPSASPTSPPVAFLKNFFIINFNPPSFTPLQISLIRSSDLIF